MFRSLSGQGLAVVVGLMVVWSVVGAPVATASALDGDSSGTVHEQRTGAPSSGISSADGGSENISDDEWNRSWRNVSDDERNPDKSTPTNGSTNDSSSGETVSRGEQLPGSDRSVVSFQKVVSVQEHRYSPPAIHDSSVASLYVPAVDRYSATVHREEHVMPVGVDRTVDDANMTPPEGSDVDDAASLDRPRDVGAPAPEPSDRDVSSVLLDSDRDRSFDGVSGGVLESVLQSLLADVTGGAVESVLQPLLADVVGSVLDVVTPAEQGTHTHRGAVQSSFDRPAEADAPDVGRIDEPTHVATSSDGGGGDDGQPTPPSPVGGAVVGLGVAAMSAVLRGSTAGGSMASGSNSWLRRVVETVRPYVFPLRYSRYDDSDPLEHDARERVFEIVDETPGSYLSAISEQADLPLSTTRHHLKVLEREDLVTGAKLHGKRRFYPAYADGIELAAALDDESTANVITTIARIGGATVGDIAEELGRDPSTVSHHLQRLDEDGLVTRERVGRSVVNRLSAEARGALQPESTTPDSESGEVVAGGAD